jgi:hypothetical protein
VLASVQGVQLSYEGHSWSRSCLLPDVLGGRLFGIDSLGLRRHLQRRSRWWSSKVKSESLARGGVTTMTLDGILNDGFLLDGVCALCG